MNHKAEEKNEIINKNENPDGKYPPVWKGKPGRFYMSIYQKSPHSAIVFDNETEGEISENGVDLFSEKSDKPVILIQQLPTGRKISSEYRKRQSGLRVAEIKHGVMIEPGITYYCSCGTAFSVRDGVFDLSETGCNENQSEIAPVESLFESRKSEFGDYCLSEETDRIAADVIQRVKITMDLLRNEKLYRDLFESMNEGFWVGKIIRDKSGDVVDFQVTDVNSACERLTGISKSNLLSKTIGQLLSSSASEVINNFAHVIKTGESLKWEYNDTTAKRTFEIYTYKADSGYIASIFSDISERKQAETALRSSEELARRHLNEIENIYSNIPVGMCVIDLELRFLRINERLAEFNGIAASEHIGKTILQIVPEFYEQAQNTCKKIIETGQPQFAIERNGMTPAKPGVLRFWQEDWLPIKDEKDKIIGISIVVIETTERKSVQNALERSLKRFELLSQLAGELLQSSDLHKVVEAYCNKVMEYVDCQFFASYSYNDNTGKFHLNVFNGIPEMIVKEIEWLEFNKFEGIMAGEEKPVTGRSISSGESVLIKSMRSTGITGFAVYPLFRKGGKIIGMLSFGTKNRESISGDDVSLIKAVADQVAIAMERLGREKKLRMLLEKTQQIALRDQAILTSMTDGIIIVSPEGKVLYMNPAVKKHYEIVDDSFHFRREEIDRYFELYDLNGIVPYEKSPITRVLAQEKFSNLELKILNKATGRWWYANYSGSPIYNHTGIMISGIITIRNVTYAARIRQQLSTIAERYKGIFENVSDGLVIIDTIGYILEMNPAAAELFDENQEVTDSTNVFTIMKQFVFYDTNSGEIIDSQSNLFQWLFKGKRIDGYEMRAVNKKNSNEWIGNFTIVPVLDQKSKSTLYSIISITNITKSKKLEQELRLKANQLASTNKELESFSYSVSHDLRAPLRAIIGFSSFLIEDYIEKFDNEGKDYLFRIKKAGEKMNDLIDDMLNLAKITKHDMFIKNVNLTELAEAIFTEIRQSNPERDVVIKIERDLKARGDERLLRIALVNLLRNAWKYTGKREKAVIEFFSKVKKGSRVFIIRDNGVGFDMNQSGELFIPFKRLHTESDFPGTGVGLAIVNKVITRHGGRIWAEAQVDKGASFSFTLN